MTQYTRALAVLVWVVLGAGTLRAADDGSGNVYVADTGNNRIQKFACP